MKTTGRDFVATLNDLKGDTLQEQFKNLYESIGKYFIANADRMSKDMCVGNRGLSISIDIFPNEIISIDRKISELLMVKEDNR